jgi:hypothetical protein
MWRKLQIACPFNFMSKTNSVIAGAAKQSRGRKKELDCFVARAPRNDGVGFAD